LSSFLAKEDVDMTIKYTLIKGFTVTENTSFKDKRELVRDLRRYSRYFANCGNPIKNAYRFSREKMRKMNVIIDAVDNFFEFTQKWLGLVVAYLLIAPLVVVWMVITCILAIALLPKACADSIIIRRFNQRRI
jgi:hypothetical protein